MSANTVDLSALWSVIRFRVTSDHMVRLTTGSLKESSIFIDCNYVLSDVYSYLELEGYPIESSRYLIPLGPTCVGIMGCNPGHPTAFNLTSEKGDS